MLALPYSCGFARTGLLIFFGGNYIFARSSCNTKDRLGLVLVMMIGKGCNDSACSYVLVSSSVRSVRVSRNKTKAKHIIDWRQMPQR